MNVAAIILGALVLVGAGFGAGWFIRDNAESNCYVLPAYTDPNNNSLLPGSGGVNPPELVCK